MGFIVHACKPAQGTPGSKIFNAAGADRSFTLGVDFDDLSDEAVSRPDKIPRYNPKWCPSLATLTAVECTDSRDGSASCLLTCYTGVAKRSS